MLLKDGRRNFSKIAEECEISDGMVWKRYRELEKAGVIVGATVQLDYSSLGYNAVGNIIFKVEPRKAEQTVEYVKKMPNIHAAWRTARTSEINVVATMEDVARLDAIKERIRKIPSVSELRTYIWTGIKNIRENLAIIPPQKMARKTNYTNEHATYSFRRTESKIDEKDKRIIEKLAVNGRVSFNRIAKELQISTDTVARRYRELTKNNKIKVSIQLDTTKIGYHGLATFYMALASQSSMISIVKTLSSIPDVVLIVQTSGSYDLLIEVMIRDIEQLLSVQDEITSIPGATRTEMHLGRPAPVFPLAREYISTF
jgi:Lrp/AsnC family transcriptional regulator for asnA, asnC and gidA